MFYRTFKNLKYENRGTNFYAKFYVLCKHPQYCNTIHSKVILSMVLFQYINSYAAMQQHIEQQTPNFGTEPAQCCRY